MTPETAAALSNVAIERAKQDDSRDAEHDPETWDRLIQFYLNRAGVEANHRYHRLIQVAALAVAAAEQSVLIGPKTSSRPYFHVSKRQPHPYRVIERLDRPGNRANLTGPGDPE